MVGIYYIARSDIHCKTSPFLLTPLMNYITDIDLKALYDSLLFLIVEILACSLMPNFPRIPKFLKFSRISKIKSIFKKYNKNYSTISKVAHSYTLWLVSINLFLIVIVFPAIVNPGPTKNPNCPNISVLFQNVRGLIPFGDLGKPSPMLDNTKLFELQEYIYLNNIDIVILNETWLINDIKNNEIFPSNLYNVYREDRSTNTYPPDPINPDKYRRNCGDVLIAIKNDIAVESKKN